MGVCQNAQFYNVFVSLLWSEDLLGWNFFY